MIQDQPHTEFRDQLNLFGIDPPRPDLMSGDCRESRRGIEPPPQRRRASLGGSGGMIAVDVNKRAVLNA